MLLFIHEELYYIWLEFIRVSFLFFPEVDDERNRSHSICYFSSFAYLLFSLSLSLAFYFFPYQWEIHLLSRSLIFPSLYRRDHILRFISLSSQYILHLKQIFSNNDTQQHLCIFIYSSYQSMSWISTYEQRFRTGNLYINKNKKSERHWPWIKWILLNY